MEQSKKTGQNRLTERVVRNEDIFCSLLFSSINRTLRVVDFRGGNFQSKHAYLEDVLMTKGVRKIYTLIERDDTNGWQRVGYHREGSIPGYYKRSDGYIMSKIYDEDFDLESPIGEESARNKKILNDIKALGKETSEQKAPSVHIEQVSEEEARAAIAEEIERQAKKSKKSKKGKGSKKSESPAAASILANGPPLFPQFSREVEFFYYIAQNRRTKQINVLGCEYQDCFGNAKVQFYFTPQTRTDKNLSRACLLEVIEILTKHGAVSIFTLERADHIISNAIYASAGFRNTGWMSRQLLTKDGPKDQILWTRKLI